MGSVTSVFVGVAAGALAVGAFAWASAHHRGARTASKAEPQEEHRSSPRMANSGRGPARARPTVVEVPQYRQLQLLDAGGAQTGPAGRGLLGEDSNANIEQLKKQQADRYRQRIADHDQEARDPSWAPGAETALTAGLQDVQKHVPTLHIEQVDCRTTSCSVKARWDSYEDAVRTSRFIIANPHNKLRCATEILLPDPADRSQPYEATALFDCTKARIAEVEQER